MRFLVDLFETEGALRGEWWSAVSNLLLPAACLSGVETNASAADLYDAWMYCSPAADYDDRQSKLLNDYVSQLARFHFVWSAYKAVRSKSESGHLLTSKNVADRNTLAGRVPPVQLALLEQICRVSLSLSQGNDRILASLKKGDETSAIGNAGLIVAGFRNYLFHGHEAPPNPEDPSEQFLARLAGDEIDSFLAYRMAYFTRLTFHLIQILTHAELHRGHEVEINHIPFISRGTDWEFQVPSRFALNLSICWPEESSLRLSRQAMKHLAQGCEVSEEILELLLETVDIAG